MGPILPAVQKRNYSDEIAGALSKGINSYMNKKNLDEENDALLQRGVDVRGIRDPETRAQLLSHDLQYNRKVKNAQVGRGMDLRPSGKGNKNINQESSSSSNENENATNDRRILSFDEQWDEANRLAEYRSKSGIPTSPEEIMPLLHARNEENKSYIATQEQFGNQAVDSLRRLNPSANEEQEAMFRQFGEQAAENNTSQSDFHKQLATYSKDFKNMVTNLEKSIPASRLFTNVKKSILGTSRDQEKEDNSIKAQLKPLLEAGQFETARTILSDKNYGPEEIESKISSLPENTLKNLASMPKIEIKPEPIKKQNIYDKKFMRPQKLEKNYNQAQKQTIYNTMDKVFKDDPSVNIVLLRKAMGDKNVDWRMFKDALDQGILNGSIQLNADQRNQLHYTESPPLDGLDKILHSMNLIGK